MAGESKLFHIKYSDVIATLIQEELDRFKITSDENDRIKLLYPYLRTIKVDIANPCKSYEDAMNFKELGNKFYIKKDNWKAIEQYNHGVIACPQDDGASLEALAILIANRSACLFDLGRFESSLKDMDYCLILDSYPQKLQYKLFLRKARCHLRCKTHVDLVLDTFNIAVKKLEFAQLSDKDTALRKNEILHEIDELKSLQMPEISKLSIFPSSLEEDHPAFVHSSVNFNYTPELGRFAVAAEDIEIGTIVVNEPAHCAVLTNDYFLTNCHYCMLSVDAPIACSTCRNVVFCNSNCMEASSYHKFECGFLKVFTESGASINCHMALRLITQQPINIIKASSKDNRVYSLCRNEHQRKIDDIFHYTIMAIFLLRLLKTSCYFEIDCDDSVLTEDEILITKLMLKHLEILEFNAHEIFEMQEILPPPLDRDFHKAIYIGGGVYPTAALFNHSCDPAVVRYNDKSRLIVRTVKPIMKGDVIYENYGALYTNMVCKDRRSFLLERYWFTCNCVPCIENWPLFENMKNHKVEIPCGSKHCKGGTYLNEAIVKPFCSRCKNSINVLLHLNALSQLDGITSKAEAFYKQRNYKEATKLFCAAMNIYYKNTIPPYPDCLQVQQRLRICMINEGNKYVRYGSSF